jgi:hypothetical protein
MLIVRTANASQMLQRIHISSCLIQLRLDEGHEIIRGLPIIVFTLTLLFRFCSLIFFVALVCLFSSKHVLFFLCSENDLDDNEEIYDKVYQEEDEEIYEDLCSRKKRESRVSFEILKICT